MSCLAPLLLVLALAAGGQASYPPAYPLGDTLTVIMRPILTVPTILAAGEDIEVLARAPRKSGGWKADLLRGRQAFHLDVRSASYDEAADLWRLVFPVPEETPEQLYDLALSGFAFDPDTARHAVQVLADYREDYYFVQVTDTHLPGHTFYPGGGWRTDTTEVADFRAVIEDINLIRPEFVLITGDYINEGELEDLEEHRVYSRGKRLLLELEVPVYLVAGNHDVGGWVATPGPDGSARRNWWRFFGWPFLDEGAGGARTEDYSFDYGPVRYIGLEAYLNYDHWRPEVYRGRSFLSSQLDFLAGAISSAPEESRKVVFYHYDFGNQIRNPAALGIDMILYGHIHRDGGSITDRPAVLALKSCSDGNRAYRVISVRDGRLGARRSVSAGGRGERLTLEYHDVNDGSRRTNGATITSLQPQPFEFAEVDFVMPPDIAAFAVTGGRLARVIDADAAQVVTVTVPVGTGETVDVFIAPGVEYSADPPPPPDALRLLGSAPNPFNGVTNIRVEIPEPGGLVEIRLYDWKGRYLFPLARGPFSCGEHAVPWDGRALSGERLPSGVYFYRVIFEGETKTGRLVLLR